jgi:8-oxo-dGTP pyrophosphatase MutT (NUDIX family)
MLRDGDQAPKLLMVKRRAGDAFGESYTFPGGVIDTDEPTSHDYADGRTTAEANLLLGVSDGLSYYSAAIRELFEETGILLVRSRNSELLPRANELQTCRQQVDSGKLPWSSFLKNSDLKMSCDFLHYFAHWETPLDQPKRWSTRFFLASMPAGQQASHDGNELTDVRWMSAGEILSAARSGEMKLPFPTLRILMTLVHFPTVRDMLIWADQAVEERIEKTRPVKITVDGKSDWVIKGDPGFSDDDDQ